jgi:hypothetical protein
MRNIIFRGFTVIGGISTVAWVITVLTAKHHQPTWLLLSIGLAAFLVSAIAEVISLRKRLASLRGEVDSVKIQLDREGRRDRLLEILDGLARECQAFDKSTPSPDAYATWLRSGEAAIAQYSNSFATEFAEPDPTMGPARAVLPTMMAIPHRLRRIHDIRRAAMTPGSHLGKGAMDDG